MKPAKRDHKAFTHLTQVRWRHRRRIMYVSLISYITLVAYIVVRKSSEEIQNYVPLIGQVSIAFGAITAGYFAGSSYEESRRNFSDELAEYDAFSNEDLG